MDRKRIEQLLDFEDVHVLVMGDIMLDEYLVGSIERISPEAPVPVVRLKNRDHRLGGAGNVAMNTSGLGAKTTIIGLIGDDEHGRILTSLTENKEKLCTYLVKDSGRKTTCKTRILSANQHVLRVDNEDVHHISDEIVGKVENMLKFIQHNSAIDVIILQDYNKGFFSPEMIAMIMKWSKANHVKTALDPKELNINLFQGVDIFKPNLKEIKKYVGEEVLLESQPLKELSVKVLSQMQSDLLVLTLSSDGIFIANEDAHHWESTSVQSIVDVSGAGDTVISIVALLYSKGDADLSEIAKIANYGGAAVCREPGVAVVDKDMILNVIEKVK